MAGEREALEGGERYIYIRVADSLYCIAETNTTLESNYTPILNKELTLWRKEGTRGFGDCGGQPWEQALGAGPEGGAPIGCCGCWGAGSCSFYLLRDLTWRGCTSRVPLSQRLASSLKGWPLTAGSALLSVLGPWEQNHHHPTLTPLSQINNFIALAAGLVRASVTHRQIEGRDYLLSVFPELG